MTTAPFTSRRARGDAVPDPAEFVTGTIISVVWTIILAVLLVAFVVHFA
ncbi:hypothetical protein [Mycobacterium sp. GA-2829]|nr:hypothetical protein [Mycobacterium sp. GA-2829]